MHDSRKTAPTFLVYAAGWMFLLGVTLVSAIGAAGPILITLAGRPVTTVLVAGMGSGATMLMQWLLIARWERWNAPKNPASDGEPIRLTPDKRHRLQTGQGA